MALKPKLTDYVSVIMQLFERFMQHPIDKPGVKQTKSLTYSTHSFIIFFMLMQFRSIYAFKAQRRWLTHHPEMLQMLGWQLMTVQSASVSESWAIDKKASDMLTHLSPETLTADDAYTQAGRIRRWAKAQVALITPAFRWTKGRYARAYHRFINQPKQQRHLSKRRSSVEPLFDLIAKVIGTSTQQKQLPVSGLFNVRCCLAIGVLSVQIAMIINAIWDLPTRNVSHMAAVFQ